MSCQGTKGNNLIAPILVFQFLIPTVTMAHPNNQAATPKTSHTVVTPRTHSRNTSPAPSPTTLTTTGRGTHYFGIPGIEKARVER